jgi:hypothetical protein
MPEPDLKRLALLMAVNCVRNTVIENYHSEGKLSDPEMKAFNQEVANKIYTFLHYLLDVPQDDREAFLVAVGIMYPTNWDDPKLDPDIVEAVNGFKKLAKPTTTSSGRAHRSNRSASQKRVNKKSPPTT